ncbi:hypothetical protein WN50_03380 [Limnoraphis robusta CS-951]|uniref:Uncharacterized protein n=1 Tax=Limnoraphis robusta CS-951 TaxID=1637645 RepID=A0A0F5YLA1_9CYAN|nr:hypothetical protein WN50_03380 [Limnoraphis robusta CS-951]
MNYQLSIIKVSCPLFCLLPGLKILIKKREQLNALAFFVIFTQFFELFISHLIINIRLFVPPSTAKIINKWVTAITLYKSVIV